MTIIHPGTGERITRVSDYNALVESLVPPIDTARPLVADQEAQLPGRELSPAERAFKMAKIARERDRARRQQDIGHSASSHEAPSVITGTVSVEGDDIAGFYEGGSSEITTHRTTRNFGRGPVTGTLYSLGDREYFVPDTKRGRSGREAKAIETLRRGGGYPRRRSR